MKPGSLSYFTIFMISFISSFEIISIVVPYLSIFRLIAASVADTAAVNPNGIKTRLANGLSTSVIKINLVFSNGPKNLPKNSPGCTILYNWVFDNFILAEELFAKALQSFETCVLVNKSLCENLFSSLESPTTFDGTFNVTSVPFLVPDFFSKLRIRQFYV